MRLACQPQGDVTTVTQRNDWGAYAYLDNTGTLHVRMFSGDAFKWVTKDITIPQVAEYHWVQRDGQEFEIPRENREIWGLVVCGDATGNFEFNELANYPAQIDWNTENLLESELELWGCWETYRYDEGQQKLWWGVQTSQGILLYDPERSDINPGQPR